MCDSKNYILTFSRVETDRQGGFWVFCGTRRPLRSVGRGCREDPPARKSLFSLVSLRLPVSLSSPLSLFAYVSLSLFIEPTYALWCSLLGPLGWTPCSLCCVSLLHSLYLHLLRGPLLPPLTLYCSPCNLTPPSIVHSILSFFLSSLTQSVLSTSFGCIFLCFEAQMSSFHTQPDFLTVWGLVLMHKGIFFK